MNIMLLLGIVLFCALQPVSKKAFNLRISGGGTYFFAAAASFAAMLFFICSGGKLSFTPEIIPYSLLFGIFLSATLVFEYLSIISGPASLASLIISYSMLLPTFYGLAFLKEPMGTFFLGGLICLMVSLFLVNKKSDSSAMTASPKWGLYVLITFMGNGLCSVTQKIQQVNFNGNYKNEFMIIALAFVLVCVGVMFLLKERQKAAEYIKKGGIFTICCGFMNGAANLFIMILSGRMNTSVMFPVISAGTVVMTHLFFRFLYKEKLSKTQLSGLIMGIVSVVLLNM